MGNWRYRVSVHSAGDILNNLSGTVEQAPPVIFCDDKGACYFDEGPNPFTRAIEDVLSELGREGWELVQVMFRPDQMICFWKRPLERG